MANDAPKAWSPEIGVGLFALALFGVYLAGVLRSGPTSGVVAIGLTVAVGVWVGSVALVHLTRREARWMIVPAGAALLVAIVWLCGVVSGVVEAGGAHPGFAALLLVPALVPALFGGAHVQAYRGRPAVRWIAAAWASVGASVVAGIGILMHLVGASGMGGG